MFDISKVKSKGRPKGSKTKAYLTLDYWFNELQKDWPKLKPAQRAKLSKELMQMLTNKMKSIPGTPEQSALNAKDALNLLSELSGAKAEEKPADEAESSVAPSTPPPPDF